MVAETRASESSILGIYFTEEGRGHIQIEMEAIRKKMASLRLSLDESLEKKLELEKTLRDVRDRADAVSRRNGR